MTLLASTVLALALTTNTAPGTDLGVDAVSFLDRARVRVVVTNHGPAVPSNQGGNIHWSLSNNGTEYASDIRCFELTALGPGQSETTDITLGDLPSGPSPSTMRASVLVWADNDLQRENNSAVAEYSPTGAVGLDAGVFCWQTDLDPFRHTITMRYGLPAPGHAKIDIFNLAGKHVASLVSENKPAGTFDLEWDGRLEGRDTATTGVYVCRLALESGDSTQTASQKIVFIR